MRGYFSFARDDLLNDRAALPIDSGERGYTKG